MPEYFIHESSYADEGCRIGKGSKIWHFCHIQSGAVIGEDCVLGQNVNVSGKAILGNGCKIQNNVSIYDGVELEEGVFCGPSMVFTNIINPRAFVGRMDECRRTLLKKGCTVGANATVVCGNTIGEYAMVGAGSVVTHDIPPYALAFGSPARIRGWICKCGEKLSTEGENAGCRICKAQYKIKENICTPA